MLFKVNISIINLYYKTSARNKFDLLFLLLKIYK